MIHTAWPVALVILLVATAYSHFLIKRKSTILLSFLLLVISPYFLMLIFSNPTITEEFPTIVKCNQESNNFSCLASTEFLFFNANEYFPKNIGDYGLFLPSFIFLTLAGIYRASKERGPSYLGLLVLLALSIFVSYIQPENNLSRKLLFVPILSVLITIGADQIFFPKKRNLKYIVTSLGLILLVSYEAARMYQIIIYHNPFA